MAKMKCVDVTKLWSFEAWGVELGGLLHALSITVDAITDLPDSDTAENEALYGLLCALMKQKREFDALYHSVTQSAVKVGTED